jgi:hypothetical protein
LGKIPVQLWQIPLRDSERLPIIRLAQDSLEQPEPKGGRAMYTLSRLRFLSFAAAGALVVLAAANTSARAEDLPQRYGPVGPNDTILATFGNKRAIAFYEVDNGRCAISAVVYDKTDAETGQDTAARVRVSLDPREMVQIDSTDNETMSLQCGDRAETLMVVDPHPFIAAGAAH